MKQRLSKLALLAVAAAFIVAGFPACNDGEDESSSVVLESIQVQTNPTKTTYSVGDTTLDPAGLVVKEVYSDGNTINVAYSDENKGDFTFDFDFSKPSNNVTVTVTYKEKPAEFTVSVAANGIDPDKVLESITVKNAPTKAAYTVGDTLDPAGLVITATYTDGSTEDIAYNTTDFTLTGFDSSVASESVTVTVTCNGKIATFTVSVAEKKGDEGEEPDPTGPTLFETLSAQENNILAEDFAEFTVAPFGAGFGKVGVYGEEGVTVADGAISTGAAGKNRKIYVDFGPVKETVEGCVTLTVGGEQPQASKNLLTFLNGDSALLTLKTGTGDSTVGGTAGTYEIYYKFDLTANTVSLTVNGKAVLTDSTRVLTTDSVSGYTIESHNSGKGTVAADNIAVCATEGDLATYKAQVKAWLATLVTNSYSEEKGYTVNKDAVAQAKSDGDSAIDAADSIETVLAAYGNAKTTLGQVKSDLAQAKADACDKLDAYIPEGKTYTDDKLAAVNAAKEAGKTAINAATTTDAVSTALAAAKEAINVLPDDNATAYKVTVIANDGTTLGTVDAYKDVASVLDEIKKLITDPTKVIAGGKFYSDSACTTDYDTATALTGDVTVYVVLEEKTTTTYVLVGSDIATLTFTGNEKEYTTAVNDFFYLSQNGVSYSNGIKLGGKLQAKKSHIKFTTTGPTTITLTFTQTSNTTNRYAQYATIDGQTLGTIVQGDEGAVKGTTVTTVFKDIPAGTYAVAGSDAILITELKVEVAD